jgi:hypothetical protein
MNPICDQIVRLTQAAYIVSGDELNYSAAVNLIITALFYGTQDLQTPRKHIDAKIKTLRQGTLKVTEAELTHYENFAKQAAYNVANL